MRLQYYYIKTCQFFVISAFVSCLTATDKFLCCFVSQQFICTPVMLPIANYEISSTSSCVWVHDRPLVVLQWKAGKPTGCCILLAGVGHWGFELSLLLGWILHASREQGNMTKPSHSSYYHTWSCFAYHGCPSRGLWSKISFSPPRLIMLGILSQ